MYKVNRKKTESLLENLGFDIGGIEDFCENAIEPDLESYINGYMLFIGNTDKDLIKNMLESKDYENLTILIVYMIELLNLENKLDIDINDTDEFNEMISRIIHVMRINNSLFILQDEGLIDLDTSDPDWKIQLTDKGKEYKENNNL